MARNRIPVTPEAPIIREPGKRYCSTVQLGLGLDLIGSKMTVRASEADLVIMDWGIEMRSRKTKRIVGLPWANIKGFEIIPDLPVIKAVPDEPKSA